MSDAPALSLRGRMARLAGSGTIATSGMEGLKTVEIIEKIYREAKKNHES